MIALSNTDDTVRERYAYLYLTMSAYADRAGFKGVAHWLFVQAQEEMAHGTHIYQHLLERGATPTFADIKVPQTEFKNIEEVFAKTLAHEQHVTELLYNLDTELAARIFTDSFASTAA